MDRFKSKLGSQSESSKMFKKSFLIFLSLSFLSHLALADDKPVAVLGTATIANQPVVRLPKDFYHSSSPLAVKTWNTYTNAQCGFSIQYPLAVGFDPPTFYPNKRYGNQDSIISFPTIYDSQVIYVLTFTDQSIKAWNDDLKNDESGDAEPYPYSLKDLREDLKLPIGSKCKANRNAEVIDFNGVKALRMEDGHGDYKPVYIILRGKKLWIEIDVYFDYRNKDNLWNKKRDAEFAVLNTFKFFEPFKADTN